MRKCCWCHILKPFNEFHKSNHAKNKIQSCCKECGNKRLKQYRIDNKDKIKTYFQHVHSKRGLRNKVVCYRRGFPIRDPLLTYENVLKKFGPNPICYLTGISIDLNQRDTYELDHIIPRAKGGDSSLNNCGLLSKQVNRCKDSISAEEFISLCRQIVNYADSPSNLNVKGSLS